MKRTLILCLILISGMLSAQTPSTPKDSQGKPHGTWEKYHNNGKLRYRGNFDHGIPVDTFKYYYEDGQLQTVNVFQGRTGNCMSFQYGEKETLAAEGFYVNKKKDGLWTYYNREGKVISKINYKNGVQNGEALKYHTNGKLAERVIYKEGKKEGPWVQYYESGKKMAEGIYVDDKLEGEATYYFSSGKPRSRGNYRHGLMHGTWYFFNSDLKLDHKEIWEMGYKIEDPEEKEEEVEKESK